MLHSPPPTRLRLCVLLCPLQVCVLHCPLLVYGYYDTCITITYIHACIYSIITFIMIRAKLQTVGRIGNNANKIQLYRCSSQTETVTQHCCPPGPHACATLRTPLPPTGLRASLPPTRLRAILPPTRLRAPTYSLTSAWSRCPPHACVVSLPPTRMRAVAAPHG